MLSIMQEGRALTESQASPEHMPSIDLASESDTLDTIVVNPLQHLDHAHARHMLPPPSNQAQGLIGNRKRYFSKRTENIEELEDEVEVLRRQVRDKKKRKLLIEKKRLEKELADM
jgi:hypothetical protein